MVGSEVWGILAINGVIIWRWGRRGEDALCCWFGGVLALKEMELCTAWFFGEMGGGGGGGRDGYKDFCFLFRDRF